MSSGAETINDERLGSPPLSQRIPIARLELASKSGTPVNDELDAYSKALLVEFSWSDLSPPPPPNLRTCYTLEWDEKPIVLPILDEQPWEWDAPIEIPQDIVYDGTNLKSNPTPADDEDTVMLIVLIPGTVPHIPKVYLRQKRAAIAPPIAAEIVSEEEPAPLEIQVKTLPQTYPLSSEFLGANYRYIADLILRDVETSSMKTRASKRGILHTVFAVRRLEDIESRLSAGEGGKHLKEEKKWVEEEFRISLDRISQARANPEIESDIVARLSISDTPTSPTATAKEWTSQATLASTSLGHRYDDPPVPWPTSPTPRYPAGAYQPNIKTVSLGDGVKAVPPHPAGPPASTAGLGLVGAFEELNVKDVPKVVKFSGDDEDEDEDLFQLPISPRPV